MIKYFNNDELNKIKRLDSFEEKCWVDLINPTDDEIEDVTAITGIPEETLKAALDEEETARIERDDGYFMCLLGDFISNRVSADTSKPVLFMLTFMFGNAKRFLSNLRQIDKKSLRVQAELHRSMKNKELIQMLALENSLVYFSTSLSSNIGVYKKMEKLPEISRYEDYQDLYDDVLIETRQAMEMCNIYRDILSGTMDAYASVISNNLNVVMKLLAVITLIISVPTLIASLWGMNVGVPFEGKAWGFWVVIGISVVVTAVVSVFVIRMSNSIRIKTPKEIKRKRRRGE